MKAREWQRFLEDQRRAHGKTVFTVTELAHASGSAPPVLNVELDRLREQGIVARYCRGLYGLPGAVTPEALLAHLDARAYLTGAYALYRHNLITQIPVEITCFTDRRHNRSRVRSTPVGRFVFVCVISRVYLPPSPDPPAGHLAGPLAGPEQALCDTVLLMRRGRVAPDNLLTFRRLQRLDPTTLRDTARRYPATVRRELAGILQRFT